VQNIELVGGFFAGWFYFAMKQQCHAKAKKRIMRSDFASECGRYYPPLKTERERNGVTI
jgi:hypothetical protein